MPSTNNAIAIIGAGIGGLAAALRLAHAGFEVDVFEAMSKPGGKMRTIPSAAGPIDAGPTVLTMKPVFEKLFADVGLALHDHVHLTPLDILARHYWDDGTRLDLFADHAKSRTEVAKIFGPKSAHEFDLFSKRAARLFDAFDEPMMQASRPSLAKLTARVATNPRLIADMAPLSTLAQSLNSAFSEPKLAQLFARYATYVGGSPLASPAILSLIWSAEARGVWSVNGGMHSLAQAIEAAAKTFGARFHYNAPVCEIIIENEMATGLITDYGEHRAKTILFNGDPRALHTALLGQRATASVSSNSCEPRSLSAYVATFAAKPSGPDLAHHTVFFGNQPNAEFEPLANGQMPTDATLYLCAQDHGEVAPDELQRFEVIMNAPPSPGDEEQEKSQCQKLIMDRFRSFGLHFTPQPGPEAMATPASFDRMFPASLGSLYGRSPHGMMSAFQRPQARTKIAGLYLCGGGAHPGAGVPMATLSGQHAAEAILKDQTSTLRSRRTVTPGGTSTASPIVEQKQSLS